MFRLKRPLVTKMHHPVFRAAYSLMYRVDEAVAPRVCPDESLIISGFWRSGTTWIQNSLAELIGAKIVFEPFSPFNPEMGRVLALAGLSFQSTHSNMFMPYVGTGAAHDHPVFMLLEQARRGTLRHRWTRLYRSRLTDAFRSAVVVKFTRAALALPAIQGRCPNPILHIRRDPRAVIASAIYKTERMGGKFTSHFNLEHFLLGIADGREDYFKDYERDILRLQEKELPLRLAGYWALTEKYLSGSLSEARPRTRFIQYEVIADEPERHALEILRDLGYPSPDNSKLHLLHEISLSTILKHQSRSDQIAGWKKILSPGESAEIAAIARDFGFEDALAG